MLSSAGADGRVHDMEMVKGEPHYQVTKRRLLFLQPGTELLVKPLLPGIRQLNPARTDPFLGGAHPHQGPAGTQGSGGHAARVHRAAAARDLHHSLPAEGS